MVEPGGQQRNDQFAALEARLRASSHQIAFPPVPDLWPAIERELRSEPPPVQRRPAFFVSNWPAHLRFVVSAVIIVVIVVAALVAVPGLRQAVADRIGLTGVELRFVEDSTAIPSPPTGTGAGLNLGEQVTLAEAVQGAGFALKAPETPGFDVPDAIFLTYSETNRMVAFVYPSSDQLPASRYSGVGALLTQFRGTSERGMISKGILVDSGITAVTVNGAPGYWIDGAAHFFMYEDPVGEFQVEEYRLAGNVLLWEDDGITYRLESELTRESAVAIAESLRPVMEMGTN